jgi:RIO-like serine/threonine protein kinase
VLMLEFVDAIPLSSTAISKTVAMAALSSLAILHSVGIIHGDISASNLFVREEEGSLNIVWLDFSSSWIDASPNQLSWEMDRAREYFSLWVCLLNTSALTS